MFEGLECATVGINNKIPNRKVVIFDKIPNQTKACFDKIPNQTFIER
jgi:hypothetical protein